MLGQNLVSAINFFSTFFVRPKIGDKCRDSSRLPNPETTPFVILLKKKKNSVERIGYLHLVGFCLGQFLFREKVEK